MRRRLRLAAAGALLAGAERTLAGLEREFPGHYHTTKETLRAHVAQMKERRR